MVRDKKGRFIKGHPGVSPGRPKKSREERFFEITTSKVTYKDWEDIVKKAVEQAKRGNHTARKFLADYLIGPPLQRHDITSDGEKIIDHEGHNRAISSLADALGKVISKEGQ